MRNSRNNSVCYKIKFILFNEFKLNKIKNKVSRLTGHKGFREIAHLGYSKRGRPDS